MGIQEQMDVIRRTLTQADEYPAAHPAAIGLVMIAVSQLCDVVEQQQADIVARDHWLQQAARTIEKYGERYGPLSQL